MGEQPRRRLFGFEVGRRDRELDDRFAVLTRRADVAGVQWRDLVQDGYRVPGDLQVGGVLMRYNWEWRIAELERRLGGQAE